MEPYQIIRSKRRTVSLEISRDGDLIVRVPFRVSKDQIRKVVQRHIKWIEKNTQRVLTQKRQCPKKCYKEGEEFLFLGRVYSLRYSGQLEDIAIFDGYLYISERYRSDVRNALFIWYIGMAQKIIPERVQCYSSSVSKQYGKINITKAMKRWGSCASNGNLNFSWRLALMPVKVIDYIVVHELCHLEHRNHSRAFWARVRSIMPDYRGRVTWLKENDHLLIL